jgi:hypothetical protein
VSLSPVGNPERLALALAALCVAALATLDFVGGAAFASSLTGAVVGPEALVGVAYVCARCAVVVYVPIALFAVLLSWSLSCLAQRSVPSPSRDA